MTYGDAIDGPDAGVGAIPAPDPLMFDVGWRFVTKPYALGLGNHPSFNPTQHDPTKPLNGGRFDGVHRDPADLLFSPYSVLYVGVSLIVAYHELFAVASQRAAAQGIIFSLDPNRYIEAIEALEPLQVVSLEHDWDGRAVPNEVGSRPTSEYWVTRAWAAWIHRYTPNCEGLSYYGRRGRGMCFVAFGSLDPTVCTVKQRLKIVKSESVTSSEGRRLLAQRAVPRLAACPW